MPYLVIVLLFFQACAKKDIGPEDTLRDYIRYRFSKNQDKETLLKKTTGELYEDLNALDEKTLNALVNVETYRRGSLRINLKKCKPTRCYITYTLAITKRKDGKKDFEIEVKKIAQIEREGEVWKISKITELKSYFGAEKPIDVKTPGETRNPFQ